MKIVISASRRTDIPAFYLSWFMEHLKNKYIDIPNPFNRKQVKRISLSRGDVGWIIFWSRNFAPFLKKYQYFRDYNLFFHFTINPPNTILEPDMISTSSAMNQLEKLVTLFGPEFVIWRYDPIVFYTLNDKPQTNHNIKMFEEYVKKVSYLGVKKCYTSFVFLYKKVENRSRKIPGFSYLDMELKFKFRILKEMQNIVSSFGVEIYSCSNEKLLCVKGIKKGHCIDGKLLNRFSEKKVSEKQHNIRPNCGCTFSIDIGDYIRTPCKYSCLYCYARH